MLQQINIDKTFSTFFRKNRSIFLFVTVLFLIGVIFGTLVFNGTSAEQRSELSNYIFSYISSGEIASASEIFASSFIQNIKLAITIWILGVSIIGAPFSLIILFGNGALVGFTIGFLVNQGGWNGFLLVCQLVLPHTIIFIPTLILLTVCSIIFTKSMVRRLFNKDSIPIVKQFKWYITMLLVCITLLTFASLIEAYFCTFLILLTT